VKLDANSSSRVLFLPSMLAIHSLFYMSSVSGIFAVVFRSHFCAFAVDYLLKSFCFQAGVCCDNILPVCEHDSLQTTRGNFCLIYNLGGTFGGKDELFRF